MEFTSQLNRIQFCIVKILEQLSPNRRVQLVLLLLLILMTSIAEIVGIGAVFPFLAVLMAPETIFQVNFFGGLLSYFGIERADELLLPLTLTFIFSNIISGIMRFSLLWYQTKISYGIGSDFSVDMYRNTLFQPFEVHISRNSSEIIAGISSKASGVVYFMLIPVLTIISSFFLLSAILLVLFFIDIKLTLVTFSSLVLIYFCISLFSSKKLYKNSQIINEKSDLLIKALQEGLGGIRDVIIDGAQEIYVTTYKIADNNLKDAQAKVQILSNGPRFFIESLGISLIAILAFKLTLEDKGYQAIPLLGVIALGIQRMLPIVQQMYSGLSTIKGNISTVVEAINLIDPSQKVVNKIVSDKNFSCNEIRISNGTFGYDGSSSMALKSINIKISKGEKIGFYGATGCGKSTLLDVLMGLLFLTKGELTVDGITIGKDNANKYQSNISHVPQDVFLADLSILENIAFGIKQDEINIDRAILAAKTACIMSTIDQMPMGIHTIVGERGVKLSGGQRQRIGIARALYKNTKILMLDEATSALDTNTEKEVMDLIELDKSEVTMIIVAHRISTLKCCDLIYELQQGQIVRVGTYDELFKHK